MTDEEFLSLKPGDYIYSLLFHNKIPCIITETSISHNVDMCSHDYVIFMLDTIEHKLYSFNCPVWGKLSNLDKIKML